MNTARPIFRAVQRRFRCLKNRSISTSPPFCNPPAARRFQPLRQTTATRAAPVFSFPRFSSSLTQQPDEKPDIADRTPSHNSPESQVPAYQMTFTCNQCKTRSTHRVSKQGYYHGTVLITCPGCKNRHLISDHLKIFSDVDVTLEDIMKNKGELVKRARFSEDGDIELLPENLENSTAGLGETPSNEAANKPRL